MKSLSLYGDNNLRFKGINVDNKYTSLILILTALIWFYGFYMLALVVQSLKSFMIITILAIGYIFYFGIISNRPVHALYAFLLIVLFFPKGGNNFIYFTIEELPGVSMAIVLQSIASFAICLNMLRFKDYHSRIPRILRLFCHLVFITIIVSFTMGMIRQLAGDPLVSAVKAEELAWNVHMLMGLIFLLGCIAFIRQIQQLEMIFMIILMGGMALVVESILYVYLALPLPLVNYVFHESGRYHSIFYFDFVSLVFVIFASIGFILYFGFTRNFRTIYILIPLLFLPILPTFQRTPIISNILIVIIFLLLYKNVSFISSLIILSVFVIGSQILLSKADEIIGNLEFFSVRPEYFESYLRSWVSRAGAYVRGLEISFYALPFGVGAARMPFVMGSPTTPTFLSDFVQPGEMESFYTDIASRGWITGPHNFYVNFFGEYGLFGIILIIMFIYMCVKGFKVTRKSGKRISKHQQKLFASQIASHAILLGIGFWLIFYHYIYYWLLFFLLFVILFTPEECIAPNKN